MSEIRISVLNEGDLGGLAHTPVWFGLHDGSFDLFENGEVASAGLESLAEDGALERINQELIAADGDGQGGAIFGTRGPIAAGEFASTVITAAASSNPFISLASMVLPSNDAFVGTGDAIRLFDDNGQFISRIVLDINGDDIYDAGTERNTELDAAFINQTAPNTGETEGGVVRLHEGFNGSLGAPIGEGDQLILGGTNAFGDFIDPLAADFTQPGFDFVTIYINEVNRADLSDSADNQQFNGSGLDDLVQLGGGDDVVFARGGNDEILAGDGDDVVRGGNGVDILDGQGGNDFLFGGNGDDVLRGGEGNDAVIGGGGADLLLGEGGNDFVAGNIGDDVLEGGTGDDILIGDGGTDLFVFSGGDGNDIIRDFLEDEGDRLLLDVEGIDTFADLQAVGSNQGSSLVFDFADAGSLQLRGLTLDDFSSDAVILV